MGQHAEDLINGFTCSFCGIMFEEEHGYPVLCSGCYSEDKGESGIAESSYDEL